MVKIIDYDDWYVCLEGDRYYYYSSDERIEVEPIATLTYVIINDLKVDGAEMDHLFDNFCCGEAISDHDIRYIWFREVE